ncbi:MAG: hypothetical protein ABII18_06360 [bacterium]|nr:hypothetical protein [bacterium]MBU1916520.1 hypothetical protein [bacterium]
MFNTKEGSTGRLIQLCIAYFFFYVITGLTVKYFLGSANKGLPGMHGFEFLAYSTLGSVILIAPFTIIMKWYRLQSARLVSIGSLKIPIELFYIIPSGLCTGIIIPTTTIMYSLPISVMVAMIIMRGAVIIISRCVDAIQIKQGILKKSVYWEENIAVIFAVCAIGIHMVWAINGGGFDFIHSVVAMGTLLAYVGSYALRIYIMNYFKNTAGKGVKRDNKAFFSWEQYSALITLGLVTLIVFKSPEWFGWRASQIIDFNHAITMPHTMWGWAILAGTAFGFCSFFSVFIFMFKGRTATFAGLVNRLTSLVAGTTATLLFWLAFSGKFPKMQDWLSLGFIIVAIVFLTRAEKKRARELEITKELDDDVANGNAETKKEQAA